ncbi:Lachesin [Eumeta japonica]|uniref:Lachesin n=1 Tax=Eumeta variegata TaxID=151549 RepID=A0A4C1WKV6_EUMVA|nr:Lachesin [Eumeta japonica]
MIWVPNQLVGAPAGTDVTVECHTEAHPRAISYWVYDNVMVLPTKKYAINTEENSYRAHMKLTVRNLQSADFGNYRCISKNSLGETEGSIRLYEIPMPSTSPKATEMKSNTATREGIASLIIRNSFWKFQKWELDFNSKFANTVQHIPLSSTESHAPNNRSNVAAPAILLLKLRSATGERSSSPGRFIAAGCGPAGAGAGTGAGAGGGSRRGAC